MLAKASVTACRAIMRYRSYKEIENIVFVQSIIIWQAESFGYIVTKIALK